MKATIQFSAEGRMNTKLKRQRDFKRQAGKALETYKSNTTKEELCFEYINSFQTQFQRFNPKRRPVMLTAQNEYGIKKFVCSTIRATQLPYSELYDMYECASFLAGYIQYEPLDPPNELPSSIFSPTEVLNSYTGDCFDMATVLCSFLIGSGYDAYVVSGHAPKFITLRDQSLTQCPLLASMTENSGNGASKLSQEQKPDREEDSSYVAQDNSIKDSKYVLSEKEKQRIAALDTFVLWVPEELPKTADKFASSTARDSVHAWVLVLAGRREVKEHTFLEPSTGRAYTMSNSPYLSIESIWNNTNYWINMRPEKKIAQMEFDLSNQSSWEFLFISSLKVNAEDPNANGNDQDHEDVGQEKSLMEDAKIENSSLQIARSFDAPPTWVAPLAMDRKRYLIQYPPLGKKTVQYFRAKADFFARGVNSQCMVMRITTYLDIAQTIVNEIHEWFENRKDKMYKRIRYFLGKSRFVEFYHPGSTGEIKQWTEYPGKLIEVDFYVNGRLDRLCHREEVVGSKVTEVFEGRYDHLVFRSVLLTVDKTVAGARQFTLPGGSLAHELYVLKMTQAFELDPDVPPGSAIAKRSFYVREGKAVVRYHFEQSQVSGRIKTFLHTRGPNVPGVSELAITQEVGIEEDMEQLQEAIALERECYTSIKANFQQMQKIHEFRESAEGVVSIELSVFDTALDKALAEASAAVSASGAPERGAGGNSTERDSKGIDYLAPYLRNFKDVSSITKESALEIRQNCLDALKARLVERANIIQSRLNDENAKLGRKQEQFQRSQREGDLSTEDYEKYCTDAMFRIQILEQRLAAHEDAAVKKFAELDAKLASDPRLKVLKNA